MSPKANHVLARDHLDLAPEEMEEGRLGLVATLLLHAAEAAVDSLAERHGIATSPTHWRRGEILEDLHRRGVLPTDDGSLLRSLNDERKAYAYDGDEPDFGEEALDDIVARVEALVAAAEEPRSDA
jgi:hypothetical protein